jgi:hypothetical protein
MKTEKPPAPMLEGQQAFDRFREAVKTVLKVPKPPSPFGKKSEAK